MNKFLKMLAGFTFVLFAFVNASPMIAAGRQQDDTSAKQDMKDAGHDTKKAAKKTGSATKKTTKKAANKTAKKTDEGAKKVEDKTQP